MSVKSKKQPATQSKKDLVNYLVSKNLENSTMACIACICGGSTGCGASSD